MGVIINPHALPMFQDERYKKRRRGDEDKKPHEKTRPDFISNGPQAQQTSEPRARRVFTEKFLEGRLKHSNLRDQDSRAELLKYADQTGGRQYTGAAYASNPQFIHTKTLEQEKEEAEAEEKKKLTGMP